MCSQIEEAHKLGRKVASHATTVEGIRNAITAGVDSIEHGHGADKQDLEMMRAKGVYWVPTMGFFSIVSIGHRRRQHTNIWKEFCNGPGKTYQLPGNWA